MKTAIQTACNEIIDELIDKVEIGHMTKIIHIMHKHLETEKQQIIDANRAGVDMVADEKPFITGEKYFENTFKTH